MDDSTQTDSPVQKLTVSSPVQSMGVLPGGKEAAPLSGVVENSIHMPEAGPLIPSEVNGFVEKVPDAPILDQSHKNAGIGLAAPHTQVFTQPTTVTLSDGPMDITEAQTILKTDKSPTNAKSWIAKILEKISLMRSSS